MTPRMLRGMALAAVIAALAIVAIWMLQVLGLVDLIEDPLAGVIGFGLLGAGLFWLSRRGPDRYR